MPLSPKELLEKYSNGYVGCINEPHIYEELLTHSKYPYFGDAAKKIAKSGKGKLSVPYKSYEKMDKKRAFKERQTGPDCTSHGTRNACDITRCVEIDIDGEPEAYISIGATEGIYGYRGFSGGGMDPARAAKFVSTVGGILLRQNYDGIVDLSKYKFSIGNSWGGRGVPDKVIDIANDHQVRTVSLIKTVEEARDALANGYGLSVGSNYGFSSKRDSKGFCKPSGSWNHCMCVGACDDTQGNMDFMIINSWGAWCQGGHPSWGPIPDGCFLIKAETMQGMINAGRTYAFSNFDGFKPQKLPDYGFTY
jgi:hypothetical protein